ncbi:winged helix-turn-helix transcriptional regulator [Streptomyces sp. NPDC047917]|uniref:winged helix-turn-helix transcriptional regulator n=1 Tax=Streptomyces sp. NPDC047917 TaxID=3365491 RepID=UPI00371DB440
MLTRTLRGLERDGVVHSTVHATVPPRVEYRLTEAGGALREAVNGMCARTRRCLDETSRLHEARACRHEWPSGTPAAAAVPPFGRATGGVRPRCRPWIHSLVWSNRPVMARAPGCGGAKRALWCAGPRCVPGGRWHPSSSSPNRRFLPFPPSGRRTRTNCTSSSGCAGGR